MVITIKLRQDTRDNWAILNPILDKDEVVIELPSRRFKVGDSVRRYLDLPYSMQLPLVINPTFNRVRRR